jgi:hypothetical protein
VTPLDSIKPYKSAQLCAFSVAVLILERAARTKTRLHGNSSIAAQFGDLAIRAMRLRFSHVDGCEQWLLAELEAEALTR